MLGLRAYLTLGAVAALLTVHPVSAQQSVAEEAQADDRRVEAIEDLIQSHVDAGLFEGSVLVAEKDTVLFHRAYGLADKTWGIENRTDTRFHIGSVGKQMTGAIILQLVEEGKLDLDKTVSEVLPDYPAEQGSKVPVRTLMNHTSGIPNYTRMPEFQRLAGSPISQADLQALFSDKPLDFEPGAGFSYNNSGFFLLSRIIEQIEGQSFAAVARARLFEPLGLEDTGYIEDRRIIPRFAEAYNWGGARYIAEAPTHESWILGNAMIYSDTDDLFRWTRALFAGTPFRSAETRDMMLELPEGAERNYAFGIGNVPLEIGGKAYRGVGHSGALGGFRSTQSIVVEPQWTVIVLSNIGVDQNAMADKVLRLLGGETVEHAKPPVSRVVGARLHDEPFDSLSAWFETELARGLPSYDFDEGGMNALGYSLLGQGDLAAATNVFRLNTIAHPTSGNVYDSLGEALMAGGDNQQAFESYRKSLELDPDNANAMAKVSELRALLGETE